MPSADDDVIAPAWAIPLFNQLNHVQTELNHVQAVLNAMMRNERSKKQNQRTFCSLSNLPLVPLVKQVAGFGPPLPGQPVLPQPLVLPQVGEVFPAPFPNNTNAAYQLSLAQLNQLACWANQDFDIVAGDLLGIQRQKFVSFITGE